MKTHTNTTRSGAALIVVLMLITFLAAITGAVITNVASKRATLGSSASYDLAMIAAEAGANQAMAQVAQSLALCTGNSLDKLITMPSPVPTANGIVYGSPQSFDAALGASDNVGVVSAAGQPLTVVAQPTSTIASLTNSANTEGAITYNGRYTITPFWVTYNGLARPYYRINSTGMAGLPGSKRVPNDFRDIVLRKLNVTATDRSVTRKLEVILRPVYNTSSAIVTDKGLLLNNHNIQVDSFDSSSATRSLAGMPSITVGYFNTYPSTIYDANIATNSQFIQAGGATIYGDALTQDGAVDNSTNVLGEIRGDYNSPLKATVAPAWSSYFSYAWSPKNGGGYTMPNSGNSAIKNGTSYILGGSQASPARYVISSVALSGSGSALIFDLGRTGGNGGNGAADSTMKYVEMYVVGDFKTKGGGASSDGSVQILNGVQVTLFIGGDLAVGGNGIENGSTVGSTLNPGPPLASALSIYGINPPAGAANQSWSIGGNSTFYGTIYASGADVSLNGGGTAESFFVGSISASSVSLKGNVQVRYDSALKKGGLITRFATASWFEDVKISKP